MSTFNLPELGSDQPAAFTTARACRDWLAVQPLSNAARAQALLLRQLLITNQHLIPAGERLKMLELMRDPIAFVQTESAKKFAGKPLPLAEVEQAGMEANRALWQALQLGYLYCLEACVDGDITVLPHAALVAQRAISAIDCELIDIYHAPSDPPSSTWLTLHRIYAVAEKLEVANQPVIDSLQPKHPACTVTANYAQTLLLSKTSPYELSAKQLLQVWRWLQRWGGKVPVHSAPPLEPRVSPIIVDLASAQSEIPQTEVGENVNNELSGDLRWLDLTELSRSIKKRILRLRNGETPGSMGLGEDMAQPACENLLKHLYQQWFKGGATRQHPRRTGAGMCGLTTGFDSLHYYLSGKTFVQPGQSAERMSKQQADQIATFGSVSIQEADTIVEENKFVIEEWKILDESPAGLRLSRPLTQAGSRIGGGQLVAMRFDGKPSFMLAIARWSRIAGESDLQAGAHILPGAPQAVAVRGTGLAAVKELYREGFVLPAVPALKEPEAVIVPSGWFRTGRVIELYDEGSRQIRLTALLDRGSDFERATFERL